MKYSKINQIFWGLIIVFVDINIQNFDILPDFIGMIIAVTALPALYEHSPRFNQAFKIGIVSLILDVIVLIFSFTQSGEISAITVVGYIIGTVVYILFMYHMMYGLVDMAENHGVFDTAAKLRRGFTFSVICAVLGILAITLILIGGGAISILFIIAGFVLHIYVLYTVRFARNTILMENRITGATDE